MMAFLEKYSKVIDVLEKIIRVILIILLAGIVLIMFMQTVLRYGFNAALPWCEELALYMCLYCVLLGLSIAVRKDSHLQVDILLKFYSPRIKALMTAITSIIAIVVMIFFIRYALSLMKIATGVSPTLPITMWQVYLAFPIGCTLVILFSLENIIKNFIMFKHNGQLPGKEEKV